LHRINLRMRVLVLGASGLIGSSVAARLLAERHEVVAATRRQQPHENLLHATAVTIDIARARDPADWLPHLCAVDAVVNCAGLLQDGPGDSTTGVHRDGMAALFAACEQAGVRRLVHISALGVDRNPTTAFARTKLAGDELLMARNFDWVILRPSVIVGRPAYGGSALIRALAALPVLPRPPGTGPLAIVHLDDLVEAVAFFLGPAAPTRVVLEIAGPICFADGCGLRPRQACGCHTGCSRRCPVSRTQSGCSAGARRCAARRCGRSCAARLEKRANGRG